MEVWYKKSSEQFAILKEILNRENKTIYLREYDYLGFYSCHMIVPDFSEIYPLEDMIYNNKNQGKLIRDFILNKDKYDLENLLDELSGFDDSVNMGAFIGVPTLIAKTPQIKVKIIDKILFSDKKNTKIKKITIKLKR